MAEDKIDSYVDRSGFTADTEFVLGQLNTIYEAFKKIDGIKISLGKTSGLNEAIQVVKQADKEISIITESQTRLAESAKKVADSTKQEVQGINEISTALAKNKA